MSGLRERLERPVDSAFLTWFRVTFALSLIWQFGKYLARGWVDAYYLEPDLHFTYFAFGWVKPWPGDGTVYHFYAVLVLSALVTVGLWYRLSAVLLFGGVTHWFLLDSIDYNNHYYLQCLLTFVLIFLPAHQGCSLDARRRPELRPAQVPAWVLHLLRFQVGVVYFYGGLAKFDPDWLTGVPVRAILGAHADTFLGQFIVSPAGGIFFAWAGLLLDLFIVPALMWRRTRLLALAAACSFHLMNAYLFRIGVFPWFMIAATLVFLEPDWPRTLWRRLRGGAASAAAVATQGANAALRRPRPWLVGLLLTYVVVQVVFPFRHLLYPGRVTWSEEGLRFAWHMMLRHKVTKIDFRVVNEAGEDLPVVIRRPVNGRQWQYMQYDPAAVLQFAHYLAEEAARQGFPDAQVRCLLLCSLNGREPQHLIDPQVNLAAYRETLGPFPFIVPLKERLPPENPYGGRLGG